MAISNREATMNYRGDQESINWTQLILGVIAIIAIPIILCEYALKWQKNENEHEEKMAPIRSAEKEKDRLEKQKERKTNIFKTVWQGLIKIGTSFISTL